jgi:hypothetical protein
MDGLEGVIILSNGMKLKLTLTDGLWTLNSALDSTRALTTTRADNLLWHERVGHISMSKLHILETHLASGIDEIVDSTSAVCPVCAVAKTRRSSSPASDSRAVEPLTLLHVDLISFETPSLSGQRWALVINDNTRAVWVWSKPTSEVGRKVIMYGFTWKSIRHALTSTRSTLSVDDCYMHVTVSPYTPAQIVRVNRS